MSTPAQMGDPRKIPVANLAVKNIISPRDLWVWEAPISSHFWTTPTGNCGIHQLSGKDKLLGNAMFAQNGGERISTPSILLGNTHGFLGPQCERVFWGLANLPYRNSASQQCLLFGKPHMRSYRVIRIQWFSEGLLVGKLGQTWVTKDLDGLWHMHVDGLYT